MDERIEYEKQIIEEMKRRNIPLSELETVLKNLKSINPVKYRPVTSVEVLSSRIKFNIKPLKGTPLS